MRVVVLVAILLSTTSASASEIEWDGGLLVQLAVADLDVAIPFYTDVLGWTLILRNDDLRWAKIQSAAGGVVVGLGESPNARGSGAMSLNFGVEDIDEARAILESRGVVFNGETVTIPGVVRLANFDDPDGNHIRLAEDLAE